MPASDKIHFIAIGGSVMHNLAIALHQAGHQVTGSDDEIFEPSRSRLAENKLLPAQQGWFPEKIDNTLDYVVIGMHARKDNPELLKAQELNLKIYSFPELIYEFSKDKQRIVIAGSHGKTTTTAIIIHVLNYFNRKFDYAVGSQINGIENSVKLSDAPVIIIEGDEYLASPIDPIPKFLRYKHHIALITGVAWDHANVFPSEEEYVKQFDLLGDETPKGGMLIYYESDPMVLMIGKKERNDVQSIPYRSHPHGQQNGEVFLKDGDRKIPVKIFGSHNFQNINGAKEVLKKIGISTHQFYEAIGSFSGTKGRLELIAENASSAFYKDFAHAPSKVKATIKAMKELHPNRKLTACMELHTYSSLNQNYLPQYKGTTTAADEVLVYYNPQTVAAKKLEPLSKELLEKTFGPTIKIFTEAEKLEDVLLQKDWKNNDLVMMTSGNFGGIDYQKIAEKIKA